MRVLFNELLHARIHGFFLSCVPFPVHRALHSYRYFIIIDLDKVPPAKIPTVDEASRTAWQDIIFAMMEMAMQNQFNFSFLDNVNDFMVVQQSHRSGCDFSEVPGNGAQRLKMVMHHQNLNAPASVATQDRGQLIKVNMTKGAGEVIRDIG
jgi:hypothetical protein